MSEHALPPAWRRGVYEAIGRRRDVRRFRPDPVAPDVLARVLWAAHHAGSVGYSQPWSFLVVSDPAIRQRVRDHVDGQRVQAAAAFGERKDEYLRLKLEGILEAPINLAVVCDRERNGPAVIGRATMADADLFSTCGAIQNLWLAARAEGLGVGWVSILEPAFLADVLHLPAHVVPVAYLCIGVPGDGFAERPELETAGWLPRLPLADVVRGDRWDAPAPAELAASLIAVDPLAPPPPPPPGQGLVVVYTGQGKGKTTAGLGLVMRALGRGYRVGVVQFIKGKWKTGERLFAAGLPGLDFHVMGEGFTWESDDLSRDQRAAQAAWDRSATMIAGGAHDVVILDELTYAISYGFVSEADILAALDGKPAHVHVVITGRHATPALCDRADLVTDMAAVKHPFARGVRAQPGLDY